MASIKRASAASVTDVNPHSHMDAALLHGGDLAAARKLFPAAPQPFVDLSTGINPHAYPLPQLPPDLFARLPEPAALAALIAIAAAVYGAPGPDHVVAAPGTQILLPVVARLAAPGRAAVLGPTYGEFARAAALAGHRVTEVADLAGLADADLAVLANPNNPDGRLTPRDALLALAEALKRRNGLLVVDEAFMDVEAAGASLAGAVSANTIVLRSFGKFFGLAGLRLGFALAAPEVARRIAALLGPWAVSGPAIAAGIAALGDRAWTDAMRTRLAEDARNLDAVLRDARLAIVGGTSLFRLVKTAQAGALFRHLGEAGIIVRRFDAAPAWLRFGLPADAMQQARLAAALAEFAGPGPTAPSSAAG
jgi:cobalamin biosynthesis protein CobC